MSSLKVHTVQSITASAALYPVLGENVIPFGLACVLIDLDHVVEYVRDTRSPALTGVFPYYQLIENNLDKGYLALSVFHTVEFLGLMFFLGLFHPVFMYILAGLAFHLAADFINLARHKAFFARALSCVEYLIRKKNPQNLTSAYQLFELENLNTAGIPNIAAWIARWRASRRSDRGAGQSKA